jgi:hypothetical protein
MINDMMSTGKFSIHKQSDSLRFKLQKEAADETIQNIILKQLRDLNQINNHLENVLIILKPK